MSVFGIDVISERTANSCAIIVLGDDFASGKNVKNRRRGAGAIRSALPHAQAVAVIDVGPASSRHHMIFSVIDEAVDSIVGHVAVEVVIVRTSGVRFVVPSIATELVGQVMGATHPEITDCAFRLP